MAGVRGLAAALVAVLAGGLLGACDGEPDARRPAVGADDAGQLQLHTPRAVHRATRLDDGRVLVTGGCTTAGCGGFGAARRSELVGPDGVEDGPVMSAPRASGTATLLGDGRVLLTGGFPGEGEHPTDTAEVYDPQADGFRPVAPMTTPRADHTASLLADGRVLVAGGFDADGGALATTEVYDPRQDRWSAGPHLTEARAAHVAVLPGVPGAPVVLVGGTREGPALASTDVFDGRRWRPGPSLRTARVKLGAAALPDGRLLVVGGATDVEGAVRLASTEILDLAGPVRAGPDLAQGEYKLDGAVVALPDGRVVVPVGSGLQVYDPRTATLTRVDVTTYAAGAFRTVTRLGRSRVLVAGGYDDRIVPTDQAVVVDLPPRRATG